MADRVLVTGISGFVGGHVALAALNAGYQVRGSLRSLERSEKVRATLEKAGGDVSRLEFVELDLLQDDGWTEAMHGVRFLLHVASPFVIDQPEDPDELIRPAVDGTRRALEAALAAGVERVVLTSSAAAIMYGHPAGRDEPYTESDWTNEQGDDLTPYVISKLRAEKKAWEIMDAAGRRDDLVVINPTAILGPLLDEDPGTSGQIVIQGLEGRMPMVPRLRLPSVDVRDVAEAHIAALTEKSAGGRRFPMSHSSPSLLQIGRFVGAALPRFASRMPKGELPDWLVCFLALFVREARASVPEIGKVRIVDPSSAEKLIGHKLIPAEDAYAATARSAVAHGIVAEPN